MKSKKICLISPSLQMGGIEKAMATLANYFVNKGYDIHLICVYPFEPFFKIDDKIHIYIPHKKFPRNGRNIIQTIWYYWIQFNPLTGNILKTIKSIEPNVILSFGDWYPHLIMFGLKNQYPFFYCNRSNPNIQYTKAIELIRWLAYKFTPPTGIIAQTTLAAERKQKLLGEKTSIVIIPNPVREINCLNLMKENWIISVGRLHLEKGFVRLMEAFKKVEAPDWKLILVGGGKHEKEIKQKAEELGIINNVIFTGKILNVDEFLCKSKIFVLASYNEGYPNALCEGMAAGLACISFDIVAGPSDIIKNDYNGYLVPNHDIDELANKIQFLVNHPNEIIRLGNAATEITKTNSINKIGDKYLEFILKSHKNE